MLNSKAGSYQPLCLLSHDVINKVSVIIGNCDLLTKEAVDGSEEARRLLLIRDVAKSIAEQLNQHHCEIEAMIRTLTTQDRSAAKVG